MIRSLLAAAAALGAFSASPAHAYGRCNPPHTECGEGERTYRCPPCPPTRVARFAETGFALITSSDVREYEAALEEYRAELEKARPQLDAEAFREAVGRLEQGQALARSASRLNQAQNR